ncbi:tRNA (N6-isopentenyl adenosine(37)-C2)-methylthiotransferase MiaB [Thermaurantiacus sp.]
MSGLPRPGRFAIRSYGCQMNVYDAERMAEALVAAGHSAAEDDESADIRILNTCHIREKAAEKVYSDIGRIVADARDRGAAKPMIVVAGCVAQAEGEEISARARAVDVIVGPQALHRLPALIAMTSAARGPVVDLDMPAESKFSQFPDRPTTSRPSAFLTIQEGCDKFCAFCVVPYTRGAEVSRPSADVLREARRLVAGGAKELTLLGQNVNAWAEPSTGMDFSALLEAVQAIPGLARLRYTTSHPRDVNPGLIAAHARLPGLMPFLHLPVQSGSDRILAAMNRRHDVAFYKDLVAQFRSARADLALSSDFIVGFPGETEEDFAATLALVEDVGFAQAFSFKYSPRLGTPAAERDQLEEGVKAERLARLQALLASQQLAFNRARIGEEMDVLVDRPGKLPGQWIGKSPWLQSVVVDAPTLRPGDMVRVAITSSGPNSLLGRLVGPSR